MQAKYLLLLMTPLLTHCQMLQPGPATPEGALKEYGVASGPLNYQIEHTNSDSGFRMLEGFAPGTESRLIVTLFKNKDEAVISQKFEEKIVKYRSIFEGVRDPYFAILTKQIKCEPQYLPKFAQKTTGEPPKQQIQFTIQGYGNERSTLGACDDSTVHRRVYLVLLKCRNSLAEVQFSTGLKQSLDQFKPAIDSLKCLF
ncbi:MAG: hypothetical protein K0R29_2439 [Pseudobdellovibrio sp.]|nr:hypothetical protein [Pseudobdellovibrio sp.]